MQVTIYTHKGEESRKMELPDEIFNLEWNPDLVHQVFESMRSNARANTAHTKDRSEVRGGGRKPWRQKGTGRARHGSRRSPIWVGGGVTFGPRNERNYSKKINKKMRTKALFTVLSQKLRDGQILFIEGITDAVSGKTKDMLALLKALEKVSGFETINTKKHNNIYMLTPEPSEEVKRSARNISHLTLRDVRNANTVDALNYRYLVIADPEKSIAFLQAKLQKN